MSHDFDKKPLRQRIVSVKEIVTLMRGGSAFAAGFAIVLCSAVWATGAGLPHAPLGLPDMDMRQAKPGAAELGRRLFSEPRLSATGRMSCATCHNPVQGFTQTDRATPDGRDGLPLRRNTPTLLNAGYATTLMHDGAAPSLEAQVLTPLLDGNEMANASFTDLEQRLAGIPDYAAAFRSVFGEEPSMALVGSALAAYQRTLASGNSAFDRWRYLGETPALAADAQRGLALFTGKAGCASCHTVGDRSALFSDNLMHNTGAALGKRGPVRVASRSKPSTIDFAAAGDRGRHEVTQNPADLYRFRTPTLRNVALTAPYMHDGSIATLTDVVRFYNEGGGANDNLDDKIKPLHLEEQEIADVVAFLNSLTGDNVETLAAEALAAAPPANGVSP